MHSNEQLAWYGSYATGLEEGGVAPNNATNKNHAPPAIRTEQWDAGARYAFTPALGLVAGAFDIEKPYVSGEEVNSGAVSEIPVAQVRLIIASVDYRLPVLPELSFDATLTSISERMASTDNRVAIPWRSFVNVGARWRFKIGRAPETLRRYAGNIADEFGRRTNTSSVFVTNGPRRYSLSLAADFPGEQPNEEASDRRCGRRRARWSRRVHLSRSDCDDHGVRQAEAGACVCRCASASRAGLFESLELGRAA